MSSLLTVHPTLSHKPQLHTVTKPYPLPVLLKSPPLSTRSISISHICFSTSNNNNNDREEARWLREEQRWLREEQRWLREEQRWTVDRNQIAQLKLQIQHLERRIFLQGASSLPETVPNIATLFKLPKKEGNSLPHQVEENGSSVVPFGVEAATADVEEEVVRNSERVTLRKGAQGDEVRAMQEALEKLGFYSGEEDMEYASFSSGTEHAVKTWQSTVGAPENGIMTSELLEKLFMEENGGDSGLQLNAVVQGSEGTAKRVVKEGLAEIEAFHHRVFLLGENRWEDSSRLTSKNKQVGQGNNTTTCVSCRGKGRMFCQECDGTGEPNIEEQFMEWIEEEEEEEEGMKCPYCDLGYTICDACEGKPMISV